MPIKLQDIFYIQDYINFILTFIYINMYNNAYNNNSIYYQYTRYRMNNIISKNR